MPSLDSIQHRGNVFMPLNINGAQPHYFLLDTGAGVSAIDATLAHTLDLPDAGSTELAGTAGVITVSQVRIPRMTPLRHAYPVDELAWYGLTPTAQDLSTFRLPLLNTPEAGLLGNDYLQNFVVDIEFMPPNVHISRPTGFTPAGVNPARFIPFRLDSHNIMRVQGTLDGWLTVDLRVDTGSEDLTLDGPYLNITRAMWDDLRERQPHYEISGQLTANGVGGSVSLDVGRIRSLDVGDLHVAEPRVVIQPRQGYFARPDAVGFIALNLFQQFGWVTFDYPNGKLYFGPAPV